MDHQQLTEASLKHVNQIQLPQMSGAKPLYRIWSRQYNSRYQYELNHLLITRLQTSDDGRRTTDAELQSPDAELQTPNARLQTPDAKPLADTFYSDAGRQTPSLLERASTGILIR